MSKYQEPQWARPPSTSQWSIEEIKNGTIIQAHSLNLPCSLFGRAEDEVDIPTAHPSCSRLHARIAFDSEGRPWLKDLGSSHGTKVNKKEFPRTLIGTDELQQGVALHPGDVIQFGASTRLFCLLGPVEFERQLIPNKEPPEKKNETPVVTKEEDQGISWGIMDANEDDGHEEKSQNTPVESLSLENIPARLRKLYERMLARQHKLNNLKIESERIEQKASSNALSAGQTAQLQKNREREAALNSEISEIESEIKTSMGEKPDRENSRRNSDSLADELEDDVDDRTKDRLHNEEEMVEGDEFETQESLIVKWKELIARLEREKSDVKSREDLNKKGAEELKSADDDDTFFIQNELDLGKEALKKANGLVSRSENKIMNVEKLLKIVNPKLIVRREESYIGEKEPFQKCDISRQNNKDGEHEMKHSTFDEQKLTSAMMLPPPRKKSNAPAPQQENDRTNKSTITTTKTTNNLNTDMPPPPPGKMDRTNKSTITTTKPTNNLNTDMPPPPPGKMTHPPKLTKQNKSSSVSRAIRPKPRYDPVPERNSMSATMAPPPNKPPKRMAPPLPLLPMKRNRAIGPSMPPPNSK